MGSGSEGTFDKAMEFMVKCLVNMAKALGTLWGYASDGITEIAENHPRAAAIYILIITIAVIAEFCIICRQEQKIGASSIPQDTGIFEIRRQSPIPLSDQTQAQAQTQAQETTAVSPILIIVMIVIALLFIAGCM